MPPPAALLLWLGVASALLTLNALRPIRWPASAGVFAFFAGWLTDELAVQHLAVQAVFAGILAYAGALASPHGWAGLALLVFAWAGLTVAIRRSHQAKDVLEAALDEAFRRPVPDGSDELMSIQSAASSTEGAAEVGGPGGDRGAEAVARAVDATELDYTKILRVFPIAHPEVEVERNVVFCESGGRRLRLDIYRHKSRPKNAPTLVYVHGGAWILGDKDRQGLMTAHQLAARGWVCINISYRLSPRATFPEHLVDVKRAIAWVRERGVDYGCDPGFVALAGGSAGAHLASLAALTPDDAAYQPGFESADTRVQACVAYYGIYDFTDRFGHWPHGAFHPFLEKLVMKRSLHDDPEAYEKASPILQITESAPPFFVLHGDCDTLAPVEEARQFVKALRTTSRSPVAYAELPGAQHAFEIFPSIRSTLAMKAVERFLAVTHRRAIEAR